MMQVKPFGRGCDTFSCMFHLLLILHIFIGATLSGVGVVIVLVAGAGGAVWLTGAVVAGFVLAFPAAWYVARAMRGN